MALKVLINGISASQHIKGVERFVFELVKAFHESDIAIEVHLAIADYQVDHYRAMEGTKVHLHVGKVPQSRLLRNVWMLTFIDNLAKNILPDVVHIPNNKLFGLKRCPTIVQIHDLAEFRVPEKYSPFQAMVRRFMARIIANRADYIITDSEYSKKEIRTLLNVATDKVSAIWLGVNQAHFNCDNPEGTAAAHQLPDKFLLYVGELQRTKNVEAIVKGLATADKTTCGDLKLVLVGRNGNATEDIWATANKLGIKDKIIHLGYVKDNELPCIYKLATAFVFVSKYEGFGLPVLEAMACGAPVIASSATSLKEVAGEAALLVDPDDTDKLGELIGRIAFDESLRQKLREAGDSRVQEFSWINTARQVFDVYEKLRKV